MAKATVVYYDVTGAVKSLHDLSGALDAAGNRSEAALGRVANKSRETEEALKRLARGAEDAGSAMGGGGFGFGARLHGLNIAMDLVGEGFNQLRQGFSAVRDDMLRLIGVTETQDDYFHRLNDTLRDHTDLLIATAHANAAYRLSAIAEERFANRGRSQELNEQMESVRTQQWADRDKLQSVRTRNRAIEEDTRESQSRLNQLVNQQRSLEMRGMQRELQRAGDDPAAAFRMIDKAEEARKAGDLQRAEQILSMVAGTKAAEDNAAVIGKLAKEERNLQDTIKTGIKEETTRINNLKQSKAGLDAETKSLEANQKAADRRLKTLQQENRELRNRDRGLTSEEFGVRREAQREEAGLRTRQNTREAITHLEAPGSLRERAAGFLENVFRDTGTRRGQLFGELEKELSRLEAKLKSQQGQETPLNLAEDAKAGRSILETVAEIERIAPVTFIERGTIDQAKKVADTLLERERIRGAAAQSGVREGETITAPGANRLPDSPAPNTGAAAGGRTINQNVNVQASVSGGMLDAETMRQITDLVARQVRQSLAETESVA